MHPLIRPIWASVLSQAQSIQGWDARFTHQSYIRKIASAHAVKQTTSWFFASTHATSSKHSLFWNTVLLRLHPLSQDIRYNLHPATKHTPKLGCSSPESSDDALAHWDLFPRFSLSVLLPLNALVFLLVFRVFMTVPWLCSRCWSHDHHRHLIRIHHCIFRTKTLYTSKSYLSNWSCCHSITKVT
jgi:hypothetical protein